MTVFKRIWIIIFLLVFVSCKKGDDDPEPAPPPPPVAPPAHPNVMCATVNGQAWAVTGNQTSTANIEQAVYNGTPKQYVIQGYTHPTLSKNSIYVGFAYSTGTFTFESFSNYYATYVDSTGTGHFAKTGTINITAIDTSHKKSTACDKFKATFSFITTPMGGPSYTVENGVIDFEAK